jgi:hypothetical protein
MLTPQPEAMIEGSGKDLLANARCSAVATQHEALRSETGPHLPFDVVGKLPGSGQLADASQNSVGVQF